MIEIKVLTLYGCDIVMKVPEDRMNPLIFNPFTLEKYFNSEIAKAKEDERNRIQQVFIERVPPHPLNLEDSVWLKRLLNKAFEKYE